MDDGEENRQNPLDCMRDSLNQPIRDEYRIWPLYPTEHISYKSPSYGQKHSFSFSAFIEVFLFSLDSENLSNCFRHNNLHMSLFFPVGRCLTRRNRPGPCHCQHRLPTNKMSKPLNTGAVWQRSHVSGERFSSLVEIYFINMLINFQWDHCL